MLNRGDEAGPTATFHVPEPDRRRFSLASDPRHRNTASAFMKALRVSFLFLGGIAFAGVVVTALDGLATPAAAAPTNVVNAVPDTPTPPVPESAGPAEMQVTVEAARQQTNDSMPPGIYPATPLPGQPMPMPARPRPRALPLAQPMPPPLPTSPSVTRITNGLPIRRFGADDRFAAARERMVTEQLAGRGIANAAVLDAMRRVPRHQFVYAECLTNSYVDMTLVFRRGIILETPYVIAVTAEQLVARPEDRVLDVEPGTGYAAAVFSLLVKEVYVIASAATQADGMRVNLERLGYTNNVFVGLADVAQGWPDAAPFDAIVFNRPLDQFPESLLAQLKSGGRVIIPVSDDGKMRVLTKFGAQLVLQTTQAVRPTPIPGNQVEMHLVPTLLRPPP